MFFIDGEGVRISGGGAGIRTLGAFTHNGFQDRRIRPLCHPSVKKREIYVISLRLLSLVCEFLKLIIVSANTCCDHRGLKWFWLFYVRISAGVISGCGRPLLA